MTDWNLSIEGRGSILVIGFGNPLRRDDGVGPLVAEAVEAWGLPGVSCISAHQLLPEFAEPLAQSRLALFVDARCTGIESAVSTTPIEPSESSSPLDHVSSPSRLLALARDVFESAPEAWLIDIPVADCTLGEGLSASADAGRQVALLRIAAFLDPIRSATIRTLIRRGPRIDRDCVRVRD